MESEKNCATNDNATKSGPISVRIPIANTLPKAHRLRRRQSNSSQKVVGKIGGFIFIIMLLVMFVAIHSRHNEMVYVALLFVFLAIGLFSYGFWSAVNRGDGVWQYIGKHNLQHQQLSNPGYHFRSAIGPNYKGHPRSRMHMVAPPKMGGVRLQIYTLQDDDDDGDGDGGNSLRRLSVSRTPTPNASDNETRSFQTANSNRSSSHHQNHRHHHHHHHRHHRHHHNHHHRNNRDNQHQNNNNNNNNQHQRQNQSSHHHRSHSRHHSRSDDDAMIGEQQLQLQSQTCETINMDNRNGVIIFPPTQPLDTDAINNNNNNNNNNNKCKNLSPKEASRRIETISNGTGSRLPGPSLLRPGHRSCSHLPPFTDPDHETDPIKVEVNLSRSASHQYRSRPREGFAEVQLPVLNKS